MLNFDVVCLVWEEKALHAGRKNIDILLWEENYNRFGEKSLGGADWGLKRPILW